MLYSFDSGSYVDATRIPRQREFELWRRGLSDAEYQAVVDELNRRIDADDIHTSSWMPGADWTGTAFEPIYEKACRRNEESAAKFFGLILWMVLLHRQDVWGFGRYEKNGIQIEGMTYFKLQDPPPQRGATKGRS